MKISKATMGMILRIKKLRNQAADLESEVYNWFHDNGIDTSSEEFIDTVGDKIAYGEFEDEEQLQEFFKEYLKEIE